MELRSFILIFQKHASFAFSLVVLCVAGGWGWYHLQPAFLKADLTLNVARSGQQDTPDYMFDGFYRLQADERFADTVAQWLRSPRVTTDIASEAGLDAPLVMSSWFGGTFSPRRLSSQVIRVEYLAHDEPTALAVAQALHTVLNRETLTLNEEQNLKAWFVIKGGEPVLQDGRVSVARTLTVALVIGLFIAFWAVLIRHYWTTRAE